MIPIRKLIIERHAPFYITLPLFWFFVFLGGSHIVPSRHPLFLFGRAGIVKARRFLFFFLVTRPLILVFRFQSRQPFLFLLATHPHPPPRCRRNSAFCFEKKFFFLKFYRTSNSFSKFYSFAAFCFKVLQNLKKKFQRRIVSALHVSKCCCLRLFDF